MNLLIQIAEQYSVWIYAFCGFTALYQIYRTWRVRVERRQAMFTLEREQASRELYSIFIIACWLLLFMGLTYWTSNTLANALDTPRSDEPQVYVPLGLTVVPPTVEAIDDTLTAENAAFPTPQTIAGTPILQPTTQIVGTPTPVPLISPPSCPDPRAKLIRPANNENVNGVVNMIGTAVHDNFQYYRIEYAPGVNTRGNSEFSWINGGNQPVIDNYLTNVDTRSLANGPWTLRLVVVDNNGSRLPPCRTTIYVEN